MASNGGAQLQFSLITFSWIYCGKCNFKRLFVKVTSNHLLFRTDLDKTEFHWSQLFTRPSYQKNPREKNNISRVVFRSVKLVVYDLRFINHGEIEQVCTKLPRFGFETC